MRILVLIASLALAGTATADEKHKPVSVTKEVDKSSPMLASGSDDEGVTEAAAADVREKGSGMATGKRGPSTDLHSENVVHRDVATRTQAEGGDYNSSRSNKTHTPAQAPDSDNDSDCPSDGDCGDRGADAQDYNSSRSNNTNGGEANDDLHVRKKPGK